MIPTTHLSAYKFAIIDDNQNKRESSTTVNKYDLTFNEMSGEPNSLNDLKMGSNNNDIICHTCLNTKSKCMGHSGIMKLNYPVISPNFYDYCIKWLKITCFRCGGFVLGKPDAPININDYVKSVSSKLIRGANCKTIINSVCNKCGASEKKCYCAEPEIEYEYCNEPHPNITKDPNHPIAIMQIFYKEKVKKSDKAAVDKTADLFPKKIQEVFNRISAESIKLMCVKPECHPKKLILNYVRVPPNTVRPDNRSGERVDHNDITVHLYNIAKINQEIIDTKQVSIDEIKIRDKIYNLNLAVYDMIVGSTNANGEKVSASLSQRFRGKRGRMRGNILGARVFSAARNFITNDTRLHPNKLSVPRFLTKKIEIPEKVNDLNRNYLLQYVLNGKDKFPGCTHVWKQRDNKKRRIEYIDSDKLMLESGDIVYREPKMNDVILFNRQPTLMISNYTSHELNINNESVFRLNVLVCGFYNADFDGDEMNIQMPPDRVTQYELKKLSSVREHMINSEGVPLIGLIQDSVISMHYLTRNDTKLDKYHAMSMFDNIGVFPKFKRDTYSGRDIMTKLFKTTGTYINYRGTASYYNKYYSNFRDYDPKNIKLEIERGEFKSGAFDKKSIGAKRGSIFHIIHDKYGPQKALDLVWMSQQISLKYLGYRGLSMGINDFMITNESRKRVHAIEEKNMNEALNIMDKLKSGKIIAPPGQTVEKYVEKLLMSTLQISDEHWEPIHNGIDWLNNSLYTGICSGARGGPNNLLKASACGGFKLIRGATLEKDLAGRASIYHTRDSPNPVSIGYVTNSLTAGLPSDEFINGSKESRHVITVKTLSTAVTGYQDRQAKQSFDSHVIDSNRKLRKRTKLVQPLCGGNGLDPRYIKLVKYRLFEYSNNDMKTEKADLKLFNKKFNTAANKKLIEEEFSQLIRDRNKYRDIMINYENRCGQMINKEQCFVAVNVKSTTLDVIFEHKSKLSAPRDPVQMIQMVKKLCESVDYWLLHRHYRENFKIAPPEYLVKAATLFKIIIRSELNLANMVKLKVNETLLKYIIIRIRVEYLNSLETPGTPQGIRAGHGVNEPNTQNNLNAIHGTDRGGNKMFEETIHVIPKDKMINPMMYVYVDPEIEEDKKKVSEIAAKIESLHLGMFVTTHKIFYEKFGKSVHSQYKEENKYVNEWSTKSSLNKPPSDLINWCIRLEFDKIKLISKQMEMETIYCRLREYYPRLHIVYKTSNSPKLWMRIYIRQKLSEMQKIHNSESVNNFLHKLLKCRISGIEDIIAATVETKTVTKINDAGELENKKIYYIETDGCNIPKVFMFSGIDPTRTWTTAIGEMDEHVDVTAARSTILDTIHKIVPQSSLTYVQLYADEMCSTGCATAVNVHGSARRNSDAPLQLIGDSSVIQYTREAAIEGKIDYLHGISAAMIAGQPGKLGTLYFDIMIDDEYVQKNYKEKSIDDL